ncbi:hypothetical protein SDC9_35368 [bioreactor metagenome]|uniref:Uncharacterized protein n=1 Tax=bioreactor metagenome TaxID=1076179 RepID=A0A644VD82_9ZZZZ|nr:hypothetical protein [Methanocorpusculum sp.]
MTDIFGSAPDGWLLVIGFIILCFIIIVISAVLERRLRRAKKAAGVPGDGKSQPVFVEGQVYQMEDGSLAKYAGNGKFLKIKRD